MGICGADAQAERMLCLAGASWSFANASRYSRELSGLSVSASSVHRSANRKRRIDAWQATPAAAKSIVPAGVTTSFRPTAPASTPTKAGRKCAWAVCQTDAGRAAAPHEWATRKLPAPAGGWRLRPWKTTGRLPPAGRWWLRGWGFAGPNWMSWPMGALDLGACRFSLCLCAGYVGHLSRAGACRPDRPGAVRRRDDGGSTLASRARDALLGEGWPGIQRTDRSRAVSSPLVRRNAPRCVAWPITCVRMPNTWTIENAWPLAGPSAAVASKGPAKTIWDDDSNKPAPVGLFPTQIGWQP